MYVYNIYINVNYNNNLGIFFLAVFFIIAIYCTFTGYYYNSECNLCYLYELCAFARAGGEKRALGKEMRLLANISFYNVAL